MQQQKYVIRAMPAMGFTHRWCAQRPWGKESQIVVVKDDAKAPEEKRDGDGRRFFVYADEITPSNLEELRRDPHIAVSIEGSPDADPLELNAAKARIHELEQQLAEARKAHQADVEDHKSFRVSTLKLIEESGMKVSALEQAVASANSKLEEKRKK